jgi:hypothetical protein
MDQRKQANAVFQLQAIENRIHSIRGCKVMIDSDLAELYDVGTRDLNRAVKRNAARFPADFMFVLTKEEAESLRCQSGTAKERRGGRRNLPYAFTEQGVAMLSSVLHSDRAVRVNVTIMRAFVRMREMRASNTELGRRLDALEARYDERFSEVFLAIRELMEQRVRSDRRRIGFRPPAKG